VKVLFVYPRFSRHAQHHPELRDVVPMTEYLGSPSLGIASLAAVTPEGWEVEYRDDRVEPADGPTDADVVALSFFTPAATRALELADRFRAQGRTVVAGGVFPSLMPDVVAPHVDAVVVGEGEPVWPALLADARSGALKPRYQALQPQDLAGLPVPDLSVYFRAERPGFAPDDYPVQLSRGCPLSCAACAVPLSMTRELRPFPLEQVKGQLAQLGRAGKRACLTEDTSWIPGRGMKLLSALLQDLARDPDRPTVSYVGISMPMLLGAPRNLLQQAKAAGINMFYLVCGFDPVSTKAFTGQDPRALEQARAAVAKAHDHGIEPYTSFLLGNDDDDAGTVDRVLEFADRAPIRKAEFAIATPYPGTPRWHQLLAQDRITSRDWSRYNDANVVFRPSLMTEQQLLDGYLRLWRDFYGSRRHLADLPQAQRTIQF
jgi:radical SAM superfamily enzyme YgiQ (UPF0313 family)